MKEVASCLRFAVGVAAAASLLTAPPAFAQSSPLFSATGGGSGSLGVCTIVAAGGVDAAAPVSFQFDCPAGSGSASASQGAVSGSAHAHNIGNSVLVQAGASATLKDEVVFTSTDATATTADVALNVEFQTTLHAFLAEATSDGFVLIGGSEFPIRVSLNTGNQPPHNLFIAEDAFATISGTSGFTDPDTYEQHLVLRTPVVTVPLNQPVNIQLTMTANTNALDVGVSDDELAALGFPTGIDVFTLAAGVTANAPGSFLVNNRFVPPTPDISVAPTSYDFGNVTLGSSANTLVTISNTGGLDLTVTGIGLETGGSSAIAVTQSPAVPAVIHPNSTVDIQLTYTPTTTLGDQAVLDITSNDPDDGVIQVGLSGAGIQNQLPPELQIANILAFIDSSVSGQTLAGSGPGNSGPGRLNALRNMIRAAGDLIQDGFIVAACDQLLDAEQRTDGIPKPPDFVTGSAAADLLTLITKLRSTLGCR